MRFLNAVDYGVIVIYFSFLVALGLYLKTKASQSLEDYFLGGRKLPWWALGISGMASFLDITGTMIIVSFLFMLGPRGLFIEFRGGAVLILPFMLLWGGKWHRRSGCITFAEWMEFRFGSGFGGQFARVAAALSWILLTVGMIAYLVRGVGLFLSMFLPFSPLTCSLVMVGVASIYTMASGFYGVVFTDMFQSLIILIAVIVISTMAFLRIEDSGALAVLAQRITGSTSWTTSALQSYTEMPRGYEAYRHLAMFAMFYLVRHILGGLGSGGDPKYFGARSDRECGLLTYLWTWLMMIRWPMMMAFAVLGLYLVNDLFADQNIIDQAAMLIKSEFAGVTKSRWADVLATIMNTPEQYPELARQLKYLLGSNWTMKLNLVSFEGTVNPERILPAVILFMIPVGFRGMILIALIAASMSTFDSTVNMTTGLFIRDMYQRYLRPLASNRELIYMSWVFIVVLVGAGFILGYSTESINDIWGWIIMSIGAGMSVPLFLRFYWWRFNGGGFATGILVGMLTAILQRLFFPGMDERLQFILATGLSITGTIVGTYLTRPTDPEVLRRFYIKTRPFGLWGKYKDMLPEKLRRKTTREHMFDILVLPFVLLWQITLFMLPMQFIIKSYRSFAVTGIIFVMCMAAMYFLWYRQLPGDSDNMEYELLQDEVNLS